MAHRGHTSAHSRGTPSIQANDLSYRPNAPVRRIGIRQVPPGVCLGACYAPRDRYAVSTPGRTTSNLDPVASKPSKPDRGR